MVTVEEVFAAYIPDKAIAAQYVHSIAETMQEDPRSIVFLGGHRVKETEVFLVFYSNRKTTVVYIDVPPIKEPDTWQAPTTSPPARRRRKSS